jgi:hypothetical protein
MAEGPNGMMCRSVETDKRKWKIRFGSRLIVFAKIVMATRCWKDTEGYEKRKA